MEYSMTTQTFTEHGEYGRHHSSDKWVVNLLAEVISEDEY